MFGFVSLTYLYLLIIIPFFVLISVIACNRKKEILKLFGITSKDKYRLLVPLLILVSIITALLRPYYGYTDLTVNASGQDIMVVFDISPSMRTEDITPSRLEVAKRKLRDLIEIQSSNGSSGRIGIVLFSGISYLYCPLTNDYSVLDIYARSIGNDLITEPGSVISQALKTAHIALKDGGGGDNAIILMLTDGEEAELSENVTTEIAYPVFSIGFGTVNGKPIPDSAGRFIKDDSQNIIISKLQPAILKKIAQNTGGKYYEYDLLGEDLKNILLNNNSIVGNQNGNTTTIRNYNELSFYLLWVLAALIITCLLFKPNAFIPLLFICTLLPRTSYCDNRLDYEGWLKYQNKDYKESYSVFTESLRNDPTNEKALELKAGSAYKLKKYQEAEEIYSGLPKTSKNLYNLGNAQLMQQKYQDAITTYKESLQLNESNKKAQFNKQYAEMMLEEKKEEEEEKQEQENQNEEQQDEKEESSEDQEKNDSEGNENNKESDSEGEPSDEKEKEETDPPEDQESKNDKTEEEQNEKDSENDESSKNKKDMSSKDTSKEPISSESLKEQEAQAWLDSLEDAPLLLRRHGGASQARGGQKW